jgi:hypothetical protein
MIRFLVLLMVFVLTNECAYSQDFVVLSKQGVGKRFKIYVGDEFRFQLYNQNYFSKGLIVKLKNDSIFFSNTAVKLDDIRKVDIRDYNYHRMDPNFLAKASILAGLGYFFVDQFNHTVVNHDGWNVDKGVAQTSALLIATGILIHKTKKRYFRVNKCNKIRLVTF